MAPPRLDPDEPRRSAAEAQLLAHALQVPGAPPVPADLPFIDHPRAGYGSAVLDGAPVAWPMLAWALALQDSQRLKDASADLWRVDAQVALACASTPTDPAGWRALAARWLRSPGRRLVQDLELLLVLATPDAPDPDGATLLSWDALMSAAGRDLTSAGAVALREHAAVHAAWPVAGPAAWQPLDTVHALYVLEQGSPAHARAGALCWLLEQAATVGVVQIGSLRRKLADELPSRLAVAFSPESAPGRAAAVAAELEAVCLAHAVRISRARQPDTCDAETWRLARWIQTATLASPFFGGDAEALVARLRALLPPSDWPSPVRPTPTDPACFGALPGHAVDLTAHAWSIAAATHYTDASSGLRPVPRPLVEHLVGLARRSLSPSELRVELALGQDGQQSPLAPPLIAGRTLTDNLRARWLGSLLPEAVEPLLALLDQAPARLNWLATAALDDGDEVADALARPLIERWRAGRLQAWSPDERCALALGLHRCWEAGDADRWMDEWRDTEEESRPALLQGLLQRRGVVDTQLQGQVLELLLELATKESSPFPVRLDALGVALPWLSRLRGGLAEGLRARALTLAKGPRFRDSVPLRRELRRLGLEASL